MFDATVFVRIKYVIVAIKPTKITVPTTTIRTSDFFIFENFKMV